MFIIDDILEDDDFISGADVEDEEKENDPPPVLEVLKYMQCAC